MIIRNAAVIRWKFSDWVVLRYVRDGPSIRNVVNGRSRRNVLASSEDDCSAIVYLSLVPAHRLF